jgi:AraC-like DNA-binding protein
MVSLWSQAQRLLGDETIGVRVAKRVPLGAYGSFDYLFMTAASVEASLRDTARFMHLANAGAELLFHRRRDSLAVQLQHVSLAAEHLPRSVEYTFALLVLRSRLATGILWRPTQVRFTFSAPSDVSSLQRLFRAPLSFRDSVNELIVSDGVLRLPHVQADLELHAVLESHLGRISLASDTSGRFLEQCQAAARSRLQAGVPTVQAVARELGLSVRSLQRHLCDEGRTFRGLVDELRFEEAKRGLVTHCSDSEVARTLKFSHVNAFYRAFRRWTGVTPAAFRRRR